MNAANAAKATVLLIGLMIVHAEAPLAARAQNDPGGGAERIAIKFKVFDANNPSMKDPIPVQASALLFIRNQLTKKPGLEQRAKVEGPDKDGFYFVEAAKDVLVERLVMFPKGTKYNTAEVTKVVSRAAMTVYPGASMSDEEFSPRAYMAQMNSYRAILSDLFEEFPSDRDAIRKLFADAFRTQLEAMANVDRRLIRPTNAELAAARKLADEVLRLYGLRPDQTVRGSSGECEPRHRRGLRRR